MKVLVTGGAGFIGSHLVDRLVELKYDVHILDNLYRGKIENIQKHLNNNRVHFYQKDIRFFEQIEAYFKNIDYVFHLAAQSNVIGAVKDLDYSFFTNVVGTFNVLKAAQKWQIKRVIFTSSREAYGEAQYLPVDEKHPLNSKNSYGASKVAGEKYCQVFNATNNIEVAILRLANVYGERDFDRVIPIFLENVLNHQDIHIFGGQQLIDFVAVEIVVEALIQSLTNQKVLEGPVNVGSGKGVTLFELAQKIMTLLGSQCHIQVEKPRQIEVVKFTADVRKFNKVFKIDLPEDPLYYLPKMIQKIQTNYAQNKAVMSENRKVKS